MGKTLDKLVGKKVVVVGGSSGIGYGAAEILLEAGAHVTIISSSEEKVQAALKRLDSPNAKGEVGDVRNEEGFINLLVSLAPVDHLVFSGVDRIIRGDLREMNLEEAKFLFGVKFWGAVICGKASLKHDIINPGGSLTLTSGGAALKPGKNAAVGGGLNAGVCTLTKGLAADLADKKVRVNCVIPGLVITELWDKQGQSKEQQEQIFQKAAQNLPVGFAGRPQHIAEAYLYAVRADYATGTMIEIDGGSRL